MKTASRWTFAPAAVLFALVVALRADPSGQTAPPAAAPKVSPQEGEALVIKMCNECHDARTVLSRRRTRSEWEEAIQEMIQEGAVGTAKEFENVWAHLVATRGRVFINDAKAEEVAAVLGLSSKDADAIVAFRATSGRFADLDALRKVPGIDLKPIDAQAEAIAF